MAMSTEKKINNLVARRKELRNNIIYEVKKFIFYSIHLHPECSLACH
jgi:hypothetical protein